MIKQFTLFLSIILGFNVNSNAQEINTRWYSKVLVKDTVQHYLLDFRGDAASGFYGLIDIPSQNIFRIGLDSVSMSTEGQVYFSSNGLKLSFLGIFDKGQEEIRG